ncbi:MAG TPA: flotillin domain-containing protein [Polyangiaceae bacterium]|nr:flotillin domain-containing protein [Polyangiaceae bacterium]
MTQLPIDQLAIAGVLLAFIMIVGIILTRMYRRASKETSFVRTGFGGQKVIVNGGALVFPVLHEIIQVNMNTLKLEVTRANQQALITKDRMRVDVMAEFYVRVQPTEDAIANAAQTLGRRTMNPEALKELVEGKFVDALRSVAAEMTMEELHEQRVHFVQKVQAAVSEDLLKNGLELESVSLTGLDQTSLEYLNPKNAFDAQGLTRLTEQIETRRKQRNDIEQDTGVAIRQKNLEAERLKLQIEREEEYAKLEQQREIEIRRAQQATEITLERAGKEQAAKQGEIIARRNIQTAEIDAQRSVDEQRIDMERQIKEREIAKTERVETAEIARRKAVELAEQERAIAIAEKSKSQSEAQASADKARALAVQAEEAVVTVRERERADRAKQIELVKAAEEAERSAIGITVAADAEKRAADDRAAAVRTLATADAERVRIAAQGDAEAETLRVEAAAKRYRVEAEGKRQIHEADNILSAEMIAMQVKLALIKAMPSIIEESVKPMQRIEGIKILQVEGLGGGGGNGAATASGGGNLADNVVSSALRYRAQAPLVDALMKELGLSSSSLQDLARPAAVPINGDPEVEGAGRPSGPGLNPAE